MSAEVVLQRSFFSQEHPPSLHSLVIYFLEKVHREGVWSQIGSFAGSSVNWQGVCQAVPMSLGDLVSQLTHRHGDVQLCNQSMYSFLCFMILPLDRFILSEIRRISCLEFFLDPVPGNSVLVIFHGFLPLSKIISPPFFLFFASSRTDQPTGSVLALVDFCFASNPAFPEI